MIIGIIIFTIIASTTVYLLLAGHAIRKTKEEEGKNGKS